MLQLPSTCTPTDVTRTTVIGQQPTTCRSRLPGDVSFALPQRVYSLNAPVSQSEAEQLEQCTRAQTKSDLWNKERMHRLTTSKFGPVCRRMINSEKYPHKEITSKFVSFIYTKILFINK